MLRFLEEYRAYIKDNPERYWFRARLYGWGWTPARFEGWLVLVFFFAAIIGNAFRIDGMQHSVSDTLMTFIPETFALVALLIGLCYLTGEKPRWQWGVPDKYKKKD